MAESGAWVGHGSTKTKKIGFFFKVLLPQRNERWAGENNRLFFNAICSFNPPPKMNTHGGVIPVLDDKVDTFATGMLGFSMLNKAWVESVLNLLSIITMSSVIFISSCNLIQFFFNFLSVEFLGIFTLCS